MRCALCDRPAPVFTLCDEHRAQLGVSLRRDRPHYKRANGVPPTPDRAPTCDTRPTLTSAQIQAVRAAYADHSYRRLGDQIGVSGDTVARIVAGVPGDVIHPGTARKLDAWMETNT